MAPGSLFVLLFASILRSQQDQIEIKPQVEIGTPFQIRWKLPLKSAPSSTVSLCAETLPVTLAVGPSTSS
jgi:hypothetical protein